MCYAWRLIESKPKRQKLSYIQFIVKNNFLLCFIKVISIKSLTLQISSFISQVLIRCLLYIKQCANRWGYSGECWFLLLWKTGFYLKKKKNLSSNFLSLFSILFSSSVILGSVFVPYLRLYMEIIIILLLCSSYGNSKIPIKHLM